MGLPQRLRGLSLSLGSTKHIWILLLIFLFYIRDRMTPCDLQSLVSITGNIQRYMPWKWKFWLIPGSFMSDPSTYLKSIFFHWTFSGGLHSVHPGSYDFRLSVLGKHARKLSLGPASVPPSWDVIHSSFTCSVYFNTCKITIYYPHNGVIDHVLQKTFLTFLFKGSSYPWPLHLAEHLWP